MQCKVLKEMLSETLVTGINQKHTTVLLFFLLKVPLIIIILLAYYYLRSGVSNVLPKGHNRPLRGSNLILRMYLRVKI